MLDSLVRVTRRVEYDHFVNVYKAQGGSPITEVQRTHSLHVDERAPGPRVTRITPPEGVTFRPRNDGT